VHIDLYNYACLNFIIFNTIISTNLHLIKSVNSRLATQNILSKKNVSKQLRKQFYVVVLNYIHNTSDIDFYILSK